MTADPFGTPAGPIVTEPRGSRPFDEQESILRDTLHAAGVQLGEYDEVILRWLAGWEWSTVAVVASWIERATRSTADRNATQEPPR